MKWILILWMIVGGGTDKASPEGGITTATFDDQQACVTTLNTVIEKSKKFMTGVCVPSSSKQ